MDVHLTEPGYFLRLGVALALGIAIGFEREWRQRMAGLHTTAMVAAGAALFTMIAPMLQAPGTDATRIAAQVVSGIGFLAGGVILRQGATVRGLTTAATLWATAAIGVLAGFGLLIEASAAAVLIICANIVLYRVTLALDSVKRDTSGVQTTYTLQVTCRSESEEGVREALVSFTESPHFSLESIDASPASDGSVLLSLAVARRGRDDRAIEQLVESVKKLPGVFGTTWRAAVDFA